MMIRGKIALLPGEDLDQQDRGSEKIGMAGKFPAVKPTCVCVLAWQQTLYRNVLSLLADSQHSREL
jgi:hypothetical protein